MKQMKFAHCTQTVKLPQYKLQSEKYYQALVLKMSLGWYPYSSGICRDSYQSGSEKKQASIGQQKKSYAKS